MTPPPPPFSKDFADLEEIPLPTDELSPLVQVGDWLTSASAPDPLVGAAQPAEVESKPVGGREELTWGEVSPRATGTYPTVDERGVRVWAMVSGHITFRDRTYAYRWPVAHPYDVPERASDPRGVRKWQAAIVRDLLRQGARDRLSVSTALSWAGIDWAAFQREIRGAERGEGTPDSSSARVHALTVSWLCLLLPETPASIRSRPLRYRASRHLRIAGFEIDAVVDPVTGGRPSAPHHLHARPFGVLFPGVPFPVIPRKHGKGTPLQSIPVHAAYEGLVRLTAAVDAHTRLGL